MYINYTSYVRLSKPRNQMLEIVYLIIIFLIKNNVLSHRALLREGFIL